MALTHLRGWTSVVDERLVHLPSHERAALKAFVDHLYKRYGEDLLRVVLFGSKARGDFDTESDLDILVVVRMRGKGYREYWSDIVDMAWDIGLAYGVVTSLIIKDESGYAKMREQPLLLARNIKQNGIVLWTKQPGEPISQPAQMLPHSLPRMQSKSSPRLSASWHA